MAQARLIDPIADPAWLAVVESSPSAGIFHHPRWLELLRSQYGYEIWACCVGTGTGIDAGLPIARVESRLTGRRLVALPFSDVCEPVLGSHAPAGTSGDLALALAAEAGRSALDLTVHSGLGELPGAQLRTGFVRHVMPLGSDLTEVEGRFAKSQIRRGIKKSRREGLRCERRMDVDALNAFYALHLRTRRKQGVPTQPKRFIRRFKELFDAGLGFVGLVHDDGRPVAAGVFLTFKGTVTYKYGASDPRSLAKRPNNLLFADVIRWSCEDGFHSLDFGRTDLENEGLRSFKRAWGAEEIELSYTYLSERAPAERKTVPERIMARTIRRSPPFVSRLIGEALYRHAA
jgi:CelD/BcsL family acetyltransferase involved in cellulose biosynthesis